jgi:hypothetical protein
MIQVQPFGKLGRFKNDWLNARHHFSFGSYRDPGRQGVGGLVVWQAGRLWRAVLMINQVLSNGYAPREGSLAKAAANIKAAGGTFKPFPAEELKKWKASAPDFLEAWEKDTAAATKDAETPKKVAARWRQLIAQ